MSRWVLSGLRTGIKTTEYPAKQELHPGVSPGLPVTGSAEGRTAEICPTAALTSIDRGIAVDYRRCIHCFRCVRSADYQPLNWQQGYEWAARTAEEPPLDNSRFGRSLNVLVVDAGDCGSCLSEIAQLTGPYYNLHRLGFFITPTPRNADVLLIVGPVTDQMRVALKKAWHAMPTPRHVVAAGVCALSGGIFGPSLVSGGGAADVIPVDVQVPGCPPPPLAILHGLLVAVGREPPVAITSPPASANEVEAAR